MREQGASPLLAFGGTGSTLVRAVAGLGFSRLPGVDRFEDGFRLSDTEVFEG